MNGDTSPHEPCGVCMCDHCKHSRWLHALRDSPLWNFLTGNGTAEQRQFWNRS